MQDDNLSVLTRPDAAAIAAHVTPFPAFTADDDEWRAQAAAYQFLTDTLQRAIDAELEATGVGGVEA